MNLLGYNIENLNASKDVLERSALTPSEISYLRELDVTKQFDLYKMRLGEISQSSGISPKGILEALEPSERDGYFSKEYEELSKQVELSKDDYLKVKNFALDHCGDIYVKDGKIVIEGGISDKKTILWLDPETKTGEVLIGEHRYHSNNTFTGVERGEFRLSDYNIEDTYKVYGPNSDLTGKTKEILTDNGKYEIPIVMTKEIYHGMTVYVYGVPDFSKFAVATIPIASDAVVRESSSHKMEATKILAQQYVEGKFPPGTFTPLQEQELRDIANGKRAESITGFTPHHVGNAMMQYVPTEIHGKVNHIGGSWLMNENNYFKGMEASDLEQTSRLKLSDVQLDCIKEVIPLNNPDLLVVRIDEINDCKPPKAIDSDPQVAEMITPVKETISPLCMEAPQDYIQIEKVSEVMTRTEGLDFMEWKELSLDKRVEVLQKVEHEISSIAHRPFCPVKTESLGEGFYGYYSPESKTITINSDYVSSNNPFDHIQVLDTIVHEGRHAYQDYNLHGREVHPRQGDLSNWKSNEFEYGYQDAMLCGFKAYDMQPMEADARAFAEDVLKQYQEKIA